MRLSHKLAGAMIAAACCSLTVAQSFPTKPLRIVSGDAGGTSDVLARMTADSISLNLGQPAVVINRAGVQVIPVTEAARAAPDGYTLLAVGANQFWLAPFLQENVPYDPVKDFAPVTLSANTPNVVVVHPSVAVNNIRELVALAKAKPGVLNFGSGNRGSATHLAGELFIAMSQAKIVNVPYKSTGQAMTATLGNEVQVLFATVGTAMPNVKSGRLRALAVTTERPSPLAPGLPTVNESGVPGYESTISYAVFVPAKTPAGIVSLLNQTIVRHLQAPDLKKKMFDAGVEIVASSPQNLAAAMKQDMTRMGKIIREAGIRAGE